MAAMEIAKVNLAEKFGRFDEQWSPKIVAALDDYHVKLAKIEGEFVWHRHDEEDELFLVVEGRLRMRFRDRDDVVLGPGELVVVPRGVEHLPVAEEGEVKLVLIERQTVVNTGEERGERTVEAEWL